MAYYEFESEWVLEAQVEKAFEALLRYEDFSEWWPSIRKVQVHDEGDVNGLGAHASYSIRSPLLYSLDFDAKITAIERPSRIRISATGDLAGVGTYLLNESGGVTRVRYLWNVATTKPWMNLVTPIARPLFVWAHHSVMREGGSGLALYLNGRLISCSSHVVSDPLKAESAATGIS